MFTLGLGRALPLFVPPGAGVEPATVPGQAAPDDEVDEVDEGEAAD